MTAAKSTLTMVFPALLGACGQPPAPVDPVGGVPSAAIDAEAMGERLFEDLCSSCHGIDATGDGPLSQLLKIETPDLTRLAASHGGTFPRAAVWSKIDGTDEVQAHGTRVMPVWGRALRPSVDSDAETERDTAARQIEHLVVYLSSIQVDEFH